jgi:hypothetical protein
LIDRSRLRRTRRIPLGACKAYSVTTFVRDLKDHSVTPHIAIDGRLRKAGTRRRA